MVEEMKIEEKVTEALDYAIATIQAFSVNDRHGAIVKSAMILSLNQLIAQMEGGANSANAQ